MIFIYCKLQFNKLKTILYFDHKIIESVTALWVRASAVQLVSLLVCHNFLKGREVTFMLLGAIVIQGVH